MPSIWETYARKPDVDSARAWAHQAYRYVVALGSQRDEGIFAKVDEFASILKRFHQSLTLDEELEGEAMEDLQ